jgi:6-phosphogluconate dehydrogenase (decarboxylating)
MIGVLGSATGLAARARAAGLSVLALPLVDADRDVLRSQDIEIAEAPEAFLERLEHPRLHFLDMRPGAMVDEVIDQVYVTMEPGDIVLDASGSYWGDTLRRWRRMRHRAIYYLDLAFLDDPGAASHLLVAGDRRGVEHALDDLERLAAGGKVTVAGDAGAAHYALMVRDAVRLAAAHAASEAAQMLEAYPGVLHAADAGTALGLAPAPPELRGSWMLDDALRLEAAVPLLGHAVMLEQARCLDEHVRPPWLPRLGPFVRPEDLG